MANNRPIGGNSVPTHAREIIEGSAFKTYDAILAAALHGKKLRGNKPGDPLVFSGRISTLAAKNGSSETTETRNVKKLVQSGWLILIADQRRLKYHGNFTTNQYRVLLVEDWLKTHTYVRKSKKRNDKLRKPNTRRMLGALGVTFGKDAWAEKVLDTVVEAYAKAATVDHNMCPTVDQNTSATVDQNTSTADTQVTSTADTQNTSTSLLSLPVQTASSSCPPSTEDERAERREAEGFCNQEQEQPQEQEPTAEELADYEKGMRRYTWEELLKAIPDEMRGAVATKEQRERVIDQLIGARSLEERFFIAAMKEWILKRDLPIEDRRFNKWGCWLDECSPFIETQRKAQAADRQRTVNEARRADLSFAYPDMKILIRNDCRNLQTSWLVLRRCVSEQSVGVYPTEAVAREKALLLCRAGGCTGDHEVKSVQAVQNEVLFKKYPDE